MYMYACLLDRKRLNTVMIFYDNLRVKSHGYTCDSDKDSYNQLMLYLSP